ncbi:TonB-dependent receptor domain-containing protein [Arachidicoccus rhizosphaerae]|uniref:TonB-dependent receptor domain-containing protein n=1 Tax=Arachidicoccus rhizosphaerae TaxID=551991 RepID=UPI00147D4387|nr:TonB-dependent receptor [Arachidicoccus rhizosphaerae]
MVLQGRITDPKQAALTDATVQIKLIEDTTVKAGQNSQNGAFKFNGLQKGLYIIEASKTGYNTTKIYIRLDQDSSIQLQLQPYTQELEQVTVTGKKKLIEQKPDRIIYNVSGSVTSQGGNALTALSKIPGVKISGTTIGLAGKGSVKIMVNNKLLEISDQNLANYLTTLPTKDIDKIEAITSPGANFDAAGGAGIIRIVTKTANLEGWSGSVQGTYGQQNTYDNYTLNGSVNYKKDRWNGFASVNLNRHKELMGWIIGVQYPTYNWSLNDTGIYRIDDYNGTVGLGYQIGKQSQLQISYHFGYREEGHNLDGHDDVKNYITDKEGNIDSVIRSYATYNPIAKTNAVNLHYNTVLDSKGTTLSADADYFNFFRTDYSNFRGYAQPALQQDGDQNALFSNTAKQNILIYTAKADLSIPTPFATWMLGAKFSDISIYSDALYYNIATGTPAFDSSKSNIYDYSEKTQAAYIQGSKKWADFSLNAGLRAEYTKTTGHSISLLRTDKNSYFKFYPSVSFTYQANEPNQFYLEFNKRINRPTFWNLNPYRSLLTAYAYYDGNPALKPEYTSQLEIGHSYKQQLYTSLYYRHTTNSFDYLTVGSLDTFLVYRTPMNFINSSTWGIQERINLTPVRWWDAALQFNLYYTKSKSDLDYVADQKGWGQYVSIGNTFYFDKQKNFSGAVNFWCQFPEVDHIGTTNTYNSLDLGLMYTTLNKKWTLGLNATDIFKNSCPTYYTEVNGLKQSYEHFQLNRSVVFSVSYQFGSRPKAGNDRATGNEEERSRL